MNAEHRHGVSVGDEVTREEPTRDVQTAVDRHTGWSHRNERPSGRSKRPIIALAAILVFGAATIGVIDDLGEIDPDIATTSPPGSLPRSAVRLPAKPASNVAAPALTMARRPPPPSPFAYFASLSTAQAAVLGLAASEAGRRAAEPAARETLAGDAWPPDRESYQSIAGNSTIAVEQAPVSTFSIDADTASYANVRRILNEGRLPPAAAVRTEELINYFDYAYATPETPEQPFQADLALFSSPWAPGRQLLRIGLQGYSFAPAMRPRAHLVFLVDTSGSMASPDKLPLLQRSLRMLAGQMRADDRIAIVTYADSATVALPPTKGSERAQILGAIDGFRADGGTAGAAGIQLAYQLAEAAFDRDALNRVVLATDGDFNVGISDPDRLEEFVARRKTSGVYLSILGFGRGNLNDLLMQRLAQAGNGNASYIDSLLEAQKVLVDEIGATLVPIANDVKVQIELNPARVAEYRLIGYETRLLARPDFNNDRVDAGEIGSGHSVTAIYEIAPADSGSRLLEDLRYRPSAAPVAPIGTDEVAWLRIRYKLPGASTSKLIELPILARMGTSFDQAPVDARFAAAVAAFGQVLRNDPNIGDFGFDDVYRIAQHARGDDPSGHRSELLRLVRLADDIAAASEALN